MEVSDETKLQIPDSSKVLPMPEYRTKAARPLACRCDCMREDRLRAACGAAGDDTGEEAVKPWKHFLISDKRFCDNCHTRRNPTGGEWKTSKDGLHRTWECGVCVGKRHAVFDAYEFTDRTARCCQL